MLGTTQKYGKPNIKKLNDKGVQDPTTSTSKFDADFQPRMSNDTTTEG